MTTERATIKTSENDTNPELTGNAECVEKSEITLLALLEQYIESPSFRQKRPNTKITYVGYFKRALQYSREKGFLTAKDFLANTGDFFDSVSPTSAHVAASALNGLRNWAVRHSVLQFSENSNYSVRRPSKKKGARK